VVTKRFLMAVSAIVLSANTALADDLPDSVKAPGAVLETVPMDGMHLGPQPSPHFG
jgi:hypothetical protein